MNRQAGLIITEHGGCAGRFLQQADNFLLRPNIIATLRKVLKRLAAFIDNFKDISRLTHMRSPLRPFRRNKVKQNGQATAGEQIGVCPYYYIIERDTAEFSTCTFKGAAAIAVIGFGKIGRETLTNRQRNAAHA